MTRLEEMLSSSDAICTLVRKRGQPLRAVLVRNWLMAFVIKEGDYKVVKPRFSAFFSTHLDSFLKTAGINSLVVVGKCTLFGILLW